MVAINRMPRPGDRFGIHPESIFARNQIHDAPTNQRDSEIRKAASLKAEGRRFMGALCDNNAATVSINSQAQLSTFLRSR